MCVKCALKYSDVCMVFGLRKGYERKTHEYQLGNTCIFRQSDVAPEMVSSCALCVCEIGSVGHSLLCR